MRKTGLLILLVAGVLCASFPLAQGRRPDPADDTVIEWPDPRYRTLQAAIDAAPDGGTVRIAEGVYRLTEGLVVRDKTVTIEGAGCAMQSGGRGQPPRERPGGAVTHLAGPAPLRVVEAERATGLINYIGGGGVLRGVKLSGFDAGVVARDVERRAKPLAVQNICVDHTGRGVLWAAPSLLTMRDSVIQNALHHGIAAVNGSVHLYGVGVANADNSCAFFENAFVVIQGGQYFACADGFGVAAVNSFATVFDATIQSIGGPGIYFKNSTGTIGGNTISFTHWMGILVMESPLVSIDANTVSYALNIDAEFGDGIAVVDSPNVSLTNNISSANTRAGIANWGSHTLLQSNYLSCNPIDLTGEAFDGTPFQFVNAGDNGCGCPVASGACVAQSSGLAPPELLEEEP